MFTKFTEDIEVIGGPNGLPDKPLEGPDALDTAQLKSKFDYSGLKCQEFINEWIEAIAAGTAAANIGAKITVDGELTSVTLQQAIDAAMESGGDIPEGAVTADKIQTGAVSAEYTGTLTASGWTASTGNVAPYRQEVTISGVLDTDSPIIDLVASDTYSTAAAEDEAWSKIYKAVADSGTITFYAKEKPTVALNFKARCIRK